MYAEFHLNTGKWLTLVFFFLPSSMFLWQVWSIFSMTDDTKHVWAYPSCCALPFCEHTWVFFFFCSDFTVTCKIFLLESPGKEKSTHELTLEIMWQGSGFNTSVIVKLEVLSVILKSCSLSCWPCSSSSGLLPPLEHPQMFMYLACEEKVLF